MTQLGLGEDEMKSIEQLLLMGDSDAGVNFHDFVDDIGKRLNCEDMTNLVFLQNI